MDATGVVRVAIQLIENNRHAKNDFQNCQGQKAGPDGRIGQEFKHHKPLVRTCPQVKGRDERFKGRLFQFHK
jgi:hypothetical protein